VAPRFEDEELDLDLKGCKHIKVGLGDDGDGIYHIGPYRDSVFARISDGEQNAANSELRTYIKNHIPEQLLLDDYGEPLSIGALRPEHLVQLQAKLWRELPRAQAAITAPLKNVHENDAMIADMIAAIGDTLSECRCTALHCHMTQESTHYSLAPHVFVLCDRKKLECSNSLCHFVYEDLGVSDKVPQTVALEPLLDFSTLTPAFHANLFNGRVFVFRREDRKYANMNFNINSLIPKERMNFCLECLHFLWNQRVKAWLVMNRLSQPRRLESGVHDQGFTTLDCGSDEEASEKGNIELNGECGRPAFLLDGTTEEKTMALFQIPRKKPESELNVTKGLYALKEEAPTHPEATTTTDELWASTVSYHLPPWPAVNNGKRPRSMVLMKFQDHDTNFSAPSTPGPQHVDDYWLPHREERPDIKEGGVTRIEIIESAERAVPGIADMPGMPSSTPEKTRITSPRECQEPWTSFFMAEEDESDPESESVTAGSTRKLRADSPTSPVPSRLNQVPKQIQRDPNTRKFELAPPIDRRVKLPSPVYCICRQLKIGAEMVQCRNDDCSVVWFHYKCMTKGEKLSSLWGNWTCQVCKTNKEYEEENSKVDLADFKMSLLKEEVLGACEITQGVKDPYGMCSIPVPSIPVPQMRDYDDEDWFEEYEGEEADYEEGEYDEPEEEGDYEQGCYEEMEE
jgi:hypothetical protein